MSASPLIGFTELVNGQAIPETTVNEIALLLEGFAGFTSLKSRAVAAPPGSPAQGDRYLIAASPTGAWTGKAGSIAVYINTSWDFVTPWEGLFAWVADEATLIRYHSAAWGSYSASGGILSSITALGPVLSISGTTLSVSSAKEWAPNFTAAGDVYIPAIVAMTIDQGNAAIGTGTIAFSKSTAAAPSTFASTTLPATLEQGAWLKVSASAVTGFVATHLKRTA